MTHGENIEMEWKIWTMWCEHVHLNRYPPPPPPSPSPLCVRACVCLYIFLCTSTLISFSVCFFLLCSFFFTFLQAYLRSSSNNKLRRFFKSQHFTSIYFVISSRFMWWFSVVFTHFAPQWSLFYFFYISNTNLKLPFER